MKEHSDEPQVRELPRATLRRVQIIAHISLAGTLLVLVLAAVLFGAPYTEVWKMVLAHAVGGRPGNATVGLNLGFNPWFILFQSSMQDCIILLYAYSWFVAGYRRAARWPFIGAALVTTHKLAERHKERIAPYGITGIIVFVIIPVWSTGPLAGLVVAYLLGLSTTMCFAAVLTGNTLGTAIWIWAFEVINDMLSRIDERLPWLLAILILAFCVLGAVVHIIQRLWKRRKEKHAGGEQPGACQTDGDPDPEETPP